MQLRNYQQDEIDKVRNAFRRGKKRVCAVLPCGAGKTVLFAYMSHNHIMMNNSNNVAFFVHRKELVDQTIATFDRFGITDSRIHVEMVQSYANRLDSVEKPSLIVFDECHHIVSNTYKKIIDHFPDVSLVGLTATPARLDGTGLGEVFDDMEIGVDTRWLIKNRYLVDYDYYAPRINLDDAEWKPKGFDYDTQDAAERLDKAGIYGDVMKYLDLSRKTIIYAPTLEMSRNIASRIGDKAAHFDGDTPSKERSRIVEDFRSGKIRVLCNRDLIGEGFDVPDCDVCMLLRPTKSLTLYIQQSMRCMRYMEGKRATIYDFVGNVFRHGLPDEKREWSLNGRMKCNNPSGEKDILVRVCKGCFRTYPGTNPICPYCSYDNGKTKKQILEDKKAELEQIKEVEKRKKRIEEGKCRSYDDFLALAIKRGYDNPYGWAWHRAKSRGY